MQRAPEPKMDDALIAGTIKASDLKHFLYEVSL